MLFWSIIIAFPLLFLAFHFIPKLPNLKSSPKATSGVSLATKWSIIAAFAALILARFFIATTVNGYQIDFGWATNWCLNMTSLPPWEVYKSGFFVNYQPFGLIIYGLTGLLGKILGTLPLLPEGTTAFWPWFFFSGMPSYENTYTPLIIFHWGWVLTFKSFPLLADIGLAFIAYRLGKKYSSEKIGLIVAALMLICPAMMVDSAIWGQLDSVLTFFIVLSIIFLARVAEKGETKDWILASVIFTLAILIKPQAIFFVPLFFAVLIKRWKDWKNILIAIGAILATIIVVCLPFYDARFSNEAKQMGLDNFWVFGWIIDKIQGTAGQYQKYSNHAFNIYSLLGLSGDLPMVEVIKNGVPTKELKPFWNFYKVLIPAIITFATAWVFHKSAPKSSKKGAPNSSPLTSNLFLLGGIGMLALFCLMPQMHERYSYPALIMFYLAYASMPNRWLMPIIPALSISIFANCLKAGASFFYGGNDEMWKGFYSIARGTETQFSYVFVLTLVYSLFVTYKMIKKN